MASRKTKAAEKPEMEMEPVQKEVTREINRIPAGQFLLDSGLLFEINRTILHPLGLALEVQVNPDGPAEFGDLWDYRDDPEGMLYGPENFAAGRAKYYATMRAWGHTKREERRRRLGYVVQEK